MERKTMVFLCLLVIALMVASAVPAGAKKPPKDPPPDDGDSTGPTGTIYYLGDQHDDGRVWTMDGDGKLKRFYSTDTKVPRDQRSTPEEVREEILQVVTAQPGISQKKIVNELGIDGETVRYHLRVLVEQGELRTGKEGRHAVYFRDT
jgi:predicted transcriptional regulator